METVFPIVKKYKHQDGIYVITATGFFIDSEGHFVTTGHTFQPDENTEEEYSILFYNKAQLLDEKGDYQNASDALIESFNLDFSNGTIDDIEDTENYLVEMLDKIEAKGNILHCLATISAYKGDRIVLPITLYNNTFKPVIPDMPF